MHARRRSPGNGYRPSSVGLGGVGAASRMSPESSARGHGMYGSEYRNYGQGFGLGQSKPFQGPPPPQRKADIFLEAGRLATEYLVSKGLLPPKALSGKWQNGSVKNHVGKFQGCRPQEGGCRPQEGDSLHLPSEGRTSALSRLGGPVPDLGPSKKRFADEFSPSGSRNHLRGKRRMGSFKSYGSEWGQEIGKSGPWSEKGRVSPDKDGDDNSFPEYQVEQQIDKDVSSVVQKSLASELAPSKVINATSESPVDKFQVQDDMGFKAISSNIEKDLPPETDVELAEKPDETVQAKDCAASNEVKEQSAKGNDPIKPSAAAVDSARKNDCDLLNFCRFAKVPTKTRSSLVVKGSKVEPVRVIGEEKNCDVVPRLELEVPVENVSSGGCSSDMLSSQNQGSKFLDSDILKEPLVTAAAKAEGLDIVDDEEEKHSQSRDSSEGAFLNQKELSERPLEFGKCSSSMVLERGEERAGEYVNGIEGSEGTNKPREWVASVVKHDNELLQLPDLKGKESTSEVGKTLGGEEEVFPLDQVRAVDISLLPKAGGGPCIDYAEEKQLFPNSFKICDLNLMEASDANDGYDPDPLFIFPSMPERKKATAPMDIDLSMSNNSNLSDKYGRRSLDGGKVVEVIDLERDTVQDDKAFDNSDSKTEGVFSGLENFPNHTQNTNDISADQDGYGLMISELLGTDISSCSNVPENISLDNDMVLHSGEGILGDDESIYMSLGEIPISFLPVWEQPTQDYGKPF